jgi:hypothetical protein
MDMDNVLALHMLGTGMETWVACGNSNVSCDSGGSCLSDLSCDSNASRRS